MQTMREKIRAKRKQKRLRRLKVFILLMLMIGCVTAAWRYIHQPGFSFGSVDIRGTNLISEQDIIEMAGSQPPFNLFNVSADKVRTALEHDVRFKNAAVSYEWPGVLQVVTEEREPAIYVANAYQSYLKADYQGVVLGVTTAIPDAKAPVLVGEECGNVYIGDRIANPNVLNVLTFLSDIGVEANEQIAAIVIDKNGETQVQLKAGYPVYLGKAAQVQEKSRIFTTVFNEIKNKNIKAEYIDLTYEKPYVKLNGSNEVKK